MAAAVYTIAAILATIGDERITVSETSTGGFNVRWKDIKSIENDYEKSMGLFRAIDKLKAAGYNVPTDGDKNTCCFRATSRDLSGNGWSAYPHFYVNPVGAGGGTNKGTSTSATDVLLAAINKGYSPADIAVLAASLGLNGQAPAPTTTTPTETTTTAQPTDVPEGNGDNTEEDGVEDIP